MNSLPTHLGDVIVARRRLRRIDGERSGLRRVADAWCAAFVQEKTPGTVLSAITEGALEWIGTGPTNLHEQQIVERVEHLARGYRFFHWHAEFPHIFAVPEGGADIHAATGWHGGFSCVIGNPPWDHIELQEKKFFASRRPDIADAPNAAKRKKMIDALRWSSDEVDRVLHEDYLRAKRHVDCTRHLASGRYPFTARGRIKTDPLFAETGRTMLAPHGRVGMVLPTGIATDATTQLFFKDLVTSRTLVSLYDFENEDKVFPAVHNQYRFCLWTAAGRAAQHDRIDLAFRLRQVHQIVERRFTLAPNDITLLNPNTGTCPVFDYRRNAEITLAIYRRVVIASAISRAGVGHKLLLALTRTGAVLQANLSSFVLDFCARQKMSGTSISYMIVKQLPIFPPDSYDKECPWDSGQRLGDWTTCRVLELSYTTHDMAAFAMDHGDKGPPFRWDEERRFLAAHGVGSSRSTTP